jgi:hypothetical protein
LEFALGRSLNDTVSFPESTVPILDESSSTYSFGFQFRITVMG